MTQSPIAFLFPGQGSQAVGMGKELAEKYPIARQTFDEANDALGYKLSQLCFEGPEEKLRMSEITQPAILSASIAAWRVLNEKGLTPRFVAGHSLGEYSAHVAAGTITFADAVRTVRNRGKYMQEAVPVGTGAMAAILGMDLEKVTAVCGAKRAKLLPVSAPFHCSLMKPAQDRLANDLRSVKFQSPGIPVVCNVDAAPLEDAEDSRDALLRQVTGSVKWEQSIRLLISKGVQTLVDVGP